MQTFSLDLSVKKIIPLLHAKQGDVGRKFKVILTDNGSPYTVPVGASVSVWFSGASGDGNYTDIGDKSAVSVSGGEITVELITQMLANAGPGSVCLVLVTADGGELGTWNIPYIVEPLPGMGSASAQAYFTAFSETVKELVDTLETYGQQGPLLANSVAECTDITKLYVLPDGYIYAYMAHEEYPYTNQIPSSVNSDGSLYNGVKGWKDGYRLNSSGGETEQAGCGVTGFIPVKYGDVVRFKNFSYTPNTSGTGTNIGLYNSNFAMVAVIPSNSFDDHAYHVRPYTVDEETGYLTSIYAGHDYADEGYAYIRVSAAGLDGTTIITVNEEITGEEVVTYAWVNTGHAFVPADYEDRIIQAEKDIAALKKVAVGDMAVYGIVDEENNILMTGTLAPGKYTLKYMAEDGTTTDIGEFTME